MPALALLLTRWNCCPERRAPSREPLAFVAVALSIAAAILAHPPRIALFAAPLHPEQLSEVEERLASWNVTFTPTVDNVVVDAERRNDCCCDSRSPAFRILTCRAPARRWPRSAC